jgi:phosphoglycerate kinase
MKKGGQLFYKSTMRDVPLTGKTVLVRADYNVPLESDDTIADDFRIRSSIPTIQYLLEKNCKVVIISHLGRPEGRDAAYSLEVVATRLEELLESPVQFIDDCIGDKVRMGVKKASKRSVTLLENLRYYDEEEANDASFAAKLAKDSMAQYFIQDGFGVVHRAHASTAAITQYLPSVGGLLLEKEYNSIEGVMKHPEHPLVAVLGGAKVSDKIAVIEAIEPIADKILIGGAMANTFLAASGVKMGKSKYEKDQTAEVKKIYSIATAKVGKGKEGSFLQLPSDVAVAKEVSESARRKNVSIHEVADDESALDIGDMTIERYVRHIEQAKTVIWNGTLGLAELPEFAHGSARVALALALHPNIVSVIGGGDTADFVLHWDSKNGQSFTHVSTGGGASLELMSGEKLPGIESLLDARR